MTDPLKLAGQVGRPGGPDAVSAGSGDPRAGHPGMGGEGGRWPASQRNPGPVRPVPRRHIPQCSAPANRKVLLYNQSSEIIMHVLYSFLILWLDIILEKVVSERCCENRGRNYHGTHFQF